MPQYLVALARPMSAGTHRQEVGNLLVEAALFAHQDGRVGDLLHVPVSRFPASVARNVAVAECRRRRVDVLFMVDDDMWPAEGFFRAAFEFLIAQPVPSVIASPYVTGGDGREDVCVFEWAQGCTGDADSPFAVTNVVREDAARRTGVERAPNVGTGFIAYDMRAFDRVEPPYFAYTYNADHTQLTETEDCYCHRRLHFAGVPIYVSWDHWSGHRKSKWCRKPVAVGDGNVESFFLRQARAQLEQERRAAAKESAAETKIAAVAVSAYGPGRRPDLATEVMRAEVNHLAVKADQQFLAGARGLHPGLVAEAVKANAGRVQVLPVGAQHRRETKAEADARWAAEACAVGSRPGFMPQDKPFAPPLAADWAASVEGWTHPEELRWLAERAAELPPGGHWVEVGCWKGRSFAAAYLAAPAAAYLYAVDTWEGSPAERGGAHREAAADPLAVQEAFEGNLEAARQLRAGGPNAWAHRNASPAAAETMPAHSLAVCFLDAAHDYESVRADLLAWLPKVRPGGLLCGHDCNGDVQRAVNDVLPPLGLRPQNGPGSIWYCRLPEKGADAP